MMARMPILAIALLLLLPSGGCALRRHGGGGWRASAPTIDSLPPVGRVEIVPDTDAIGAFAVVDLTLRRGDGVEYRGLTPEETQCLAVDESPLGDAIDAERRAIQAPPGACGKGERGAAVMRRLLAYAAAEARNKSAGDALEAYYRLVQAEAQHDLLARTRNTLRATASDLEQARRRGLTLPPEANAIAARQLAVNQSVVEDDLAVLKLNTALAQLTGLSRPDERLRFWPVTRLAATAAPVDIDVAIAEGMALRPELNLLRYAEASLDEETLPAVRQMMGGISGILGMQPAAPSCSTLAKLCVLLCGSTDAEEAAARRRQLRQYRIDREEAVADEIRQAAYTIEARARQIALAKEGVALAQQRLSDAVERQRIAQATLADVTAAQTAALEAHGDLVGRVVEWELARVELREAQGKLVSECRGNGACP